MQRPPRPQPKGIRSREDQSAAGAMRRPLQPSGARRSASLPRGKYTEDTKRGHLFASLQTAQDGVGHTPYSQALSEIQAGQKRSHWIWYVWPSLRALRPGTSRPHFLLPNFAAAQLLLAAEPLASRLEEISVSALQRLQSGTPLNVLMGGGVDATKFREALTVFSLAAATSGHPAAPRQLDLFCRCLEAAASERGRRAAARGPAPSSGLGGPKAPAPGAALEPRAVEAVLADPTAPVGLLHGVCDTAALRRRCCSTETAEPVPPAEV